MKKAVLLVAALFHSWTSIQAEAFTHPSAPFTRKDLEEVKAKVLAGEQPWKAGYDAMAADWTSAINYGPRKAKAEVSRNPHVNLASHWRPDMTAAYNQARMWWFTGNEAYARKSRDILIDWAKTQTSFGGMEANLDLGDYAQCYVGAAEILRGTWPGWTSADTKAVQKLFAEVYWRSLGLDGNVIGPTNKGGLSLAAGAAIAVFCDDQAKLNRVLYHLRYTPSTGLLNTLANGQHGETGRDEGHSYNHIFALSFAARVLWNQGIDAFSYADNRLLAMGEYYARENLLVPLPFVPMGTTDEYYTTNWSQPGFQGTPAPFSILHHAYVVRKGMRAPYMELKLSAQPPDGFAFMYLKTEDKTTAKPLPPAKFPAYAPIGTGFEDKDVGTAKPVGGSSYDNGVWTVTGSGSEIWTHGADSFHFTCKKVTGDCAIITRVDSVGNTHPNAKAGIMIRSDLNDTPGSKLWIALRPFQPAPNDKQSMVEAYMHGWTNTYGGANWECQGYWVPKLPYWLKIERVGPMITGYASRDGTSWTPIVYGEFKNMPATAYLGLAVCGITNGTLNTSTFRNVCITGGTGGKVLAPEPPESLLASPGDRKALLRWLPSFGAASYTVKRATTAGGPFSEVATGVTTASYVDTTVSNDTPYHYVVTATNGAGTSADSQEATVTPYPAMNPIATGGTASESGGSSNEGAAKAFDRNCGSKWHLSAPNGWIQYDFGPGKGRVVNRYDLISANDVPDRDPKDWQLFGSNDGQKWSLLDTRENEKFSIRFFPRSYSVRNTTAYRFYRLHVSANHGNATGLQIGEISLMGR